MPIMKLNQWRRGRASLPVVLLLVSLVLSACAGRGGSAAIQTDETAEVIIGDLAANATAAGTLTARRAATLTAPAAARVTAVFARAGQAVIAGEPLLALDTAGAALDVAAAEQDVHAAEASLAGRLADPTSFELAAAEATVAAAKASLDALRGGPTEAELAAYAATLRSTEASLASASAELASAQSSSTPADLAAAEASLAAAQVQLAQAQDRNGEETNQATDAALRAAEQAVASAQARVDDLGDGPDTAAAQGSVGAASARLAAARADNERQMAGATAAQIAAAEAQLAQAEATLAGLRDGPTAADVAAAEADLASARLSLAEAQDALARLTMVTPFGGVLTAVHAQPGEIAAGPVVDLVDLGSLQVVLQVDEIDVGSLTVGQAASITLQSFPGVTIPAEVASIAAAADSATGGAVTYDVRLDLTDTDLPLMAGMTADALLVTAEKRGVVLAPNAAIQVDRTNGAYSVWRVAADGSSAAVPITVGLRDARYTEILDGLSAGDRVLLGGAPTAEFGGPGSGGGPFGGN